jgi:serine/threonine protein phosphatase PrpC
MRVLRGGRARLRGAAASDPGRVREQNQDVCLVDLGRQLFAVADGMGGHRAGRVAAEIAVGSLPALLDRARHDAGQAGAGAALERAVAAVNEVVHAEGANDPAREGMGTTLVVVLVTGMTAHLAHVGDSRAYLLRRGRLRRLTEDHCVAAELVRAGVLDPVAAQEHPSAHNLTQAIGMPEPVRPPRSRLKLARGDRLLLCSDGLTKMLADERIRTLLDSAITPERACEALVAAANTAGGRDNVSVVVVDVGAAR